MYSFIVNYRLKNAERFWSKLFATLTNLGLLALQKHLHRIVLQSTDAHNQKCQILTIYITFIATSLQRMHCYPLDLHNTHQTHDGILIGDLR